MDSTVYVKGTMVNLDMVNNTLGSGGEVTVIQGPYNLAYALWHDPLSEDTLRKLVEKIKYIKTLDLPDEYYQPIDIIYNRQQKPVGYTMRLLPHGALSFSELSNKATWHNYKINQLFVAKLIKNLIKSLKVLWAKGGLVVDGNHNNFFFDPVSGDVYILDILSFQYTKPDATVLMATAIQPDICPPRQMRWLTDNTYNEVFTLDDEKWWLLLLFLSSYLRAWPFFINLALDDLGEVIKHIMNHNHIFNPGQEYYPLMVALPPKSLPDRTIFFAKKALDELKVTGSLEAEIDYVIQNLVECKKGKMLAYYPSERPECPHCNKDRALPDLSGVTTSIAVGTINFKAVFALIKGRNVLKIEPTSSGSDELVIISYDNYSHLYAGWFNVQTQRYTEVKLVDKYANHIQSSPNFQYFVSRDYIAIGEIKPTSPDNILRGVVNLYDKKGIEIKEIFTGFFGKQITFAFNMLPIWTVGADIVRGKDQLNRINPELMLKASLGKTWFCGNGSDVLVGITNFTVQYQWFMYANGLRSKLPIPMKKDERVTKPQVVFETSSDFVITFESRNNGFDRKRILVIHEGQVIYDILAPTMNIGRPALSFSKKLLLVPTDKGVMKYSLDDKVAANSVSTGAVSTAALMLGTDRIDVTDTLMMLSGFIYVMSSDGTLFKLTK